MCCNIFCRSNEVFEVAEHSAALTPAGSGGDWALQGERHRKVLFAPVSFWCGNSCTQTPGSAHFGCLGSARWRWHMGCTSDPSTLSWHCTGVLLKRAKLLLVLLAKAGSSVRGWINQCHTCRWHRSSSTKAAEGAALLLLGKTNRHSKGCEWLST